MRTIHVVGAAILRQASYDRENRGAECLVTRRAPHVPHAGQWEFPGGKVEASESPQGALRRELLEELAIDVEVGTFLGQGRADLGDRVIVLDVYCCRWLDGELTLSDHDVVRWIGSSEIESLDWALADRLVLDALRTMLEGDAVGRL